MSSISEYTEQDHMLFADVSKLAHQLMFDHGLIAENWRFSWDRGKKRLGCCKYNEREISMSKILTPGQTMEQIKNTILHEIAHALVGHGAGHGPIWKAKAIEIGCDGERCGKLNPGGQPEFAWYASCDHCEYRVGMHRAPGRVRSCGKCAPWGFSWQHVMSWEHLGQTAYVDDMPEKFQREYMQMLDTYARAVVN